MKSPSGLKSRNGSAVAATERRVVRCAIYTRVSTDERLHQEFNSLDAQRQFGERYIASQQGEGWVCLPDRYDDGGFTGANLDRPALKRLLADIEMGHADCVVLYKIDRLSRSLLDFARLMDVFERKQVQFVSVSQQFSTTTSMGRLTLNMLLSFAQFERELISERTRDKITAARQNGRWAGGRPVLGYDLGGGRLTVNPAEAERVREIFGMYLASNSLTQTVQELGRRSWRSKEWTTAAGRPMGGRAFDKGLTYKLLGNVAYIGKVRHHKAVYQGQHEAIVDAPLFERVQERLKRNGYAGGTLVRNIHGALLKGLLVCRPCDKPMSHSNTNKPNGRRFRYYICHVAQTAGWHACASKSVPAEEIEKFVVEQVLRAASMPGILAAVQDRLRARGTAGLNAEDVLSRATLEKKLQDPDGVWAYLSPKEQAELVRLFVRRIEYDGKKSQISIVFNPGMQPGKAAAAEGIEAGAVGAEVAA